MEYGIDQGLAAEQSTMTEDYLYLIRIIYCVLLLLMVCCVAGLWNVSSVCSSLSFSIFCCFFSAGYFAGDARSLSICSVFVLPNA